MPYLRCTHIFRQKQHERWNVGVVVGPNKTNGKKRAPLLPSSSLSLSPLFLSSDLMGTRGYNRVAATVRCVDTR